MKNLKQSSINCLSIAAFAMLSFAVACTSPVETYIQNEFTTTIRLDGLNDEVDAEIENIVAILNRMSEDANLDAKESKRLAQSYEKAERDIETRYNNYKRTNNWIGFFSLSDAIDEANAVLAKSQRLKKKAQPYINHTKKQVDALTEALKSVDSKKLLLSANLVKNEEYSVERVFNIIIGTPSALAKPTKEDVDSIAQVALTNYFIENPTPTIKAYEFKKKNNHWQIILSNDTEYLMRAIKCIDGKYDYKYSKVESVVTPTQDNQSANIKSQTTSSANVDWDEILDDYEDFIDDYIACMKKANNGDLSAMTEMTELMQDVQNLSNKLANASSDLTASQYARYSKLMQKLANATSNL